MCVNGYVACTKYTQLYVKYSHSAVPIRNIAFSTHSLLYKGKLNFCKLEQEQHVRATTANSLQRESTQIVDSHGRINGRVIGGRPLIHSSVHIVFVT